jgi:twinkle protein
MTRQASGTRIPDPEFIREFLTIMGQGLYLYDHQGMVDRHKLEAAIRYASQEKGCKHFVIDSLMKCGIAEDDYNAQKDFVDQLCTVAKDTGTHIHLVAHSRKGKDEMTPPGKHDIRGGASISDQADNIIIVWRNKVKEDGINQGKANHSDPDAVAICCKQRNGEWEGALPLFFDPDSQQLTETQGDVMDLLSPRTYRGIA